MPPEPPQPFKILTLLLSPDLQRGGNHLAVPLLAFNSHCSAKAERPV